MYGSSMRSLLKVVLGQDSKEWTERWALEPFTHPCIDCGEPRTTSIPVVCSTMPGLVAPTCSCGNKQGPYCLGLRPMDASTVTRPV